MEEAFSNSEHYSDKNFWNERFQKSKGSFDWYVGWNELKSYLLPYLNEQSRVLMVGCGNSKMSELMYKDNIENITNIDISDVVIEQMKELYKENFEKMQFLQMDATNTTFEDNSFDVTLDKGTLDALMCAKNLEIPFNLIREMYRVTKSQKYFVVITYGRPDERLKTFLEALKDDSLYQFTYEVKEINLSLMSNLINILRNKSDNFSVSNAIKDKKILIPSVVEACIGKLLLEKQKVKEDIGLTEEEIQVKIDSINKKILNMKLMKLMYDKKFEREAKELKANTVQQDDQIKQVDSDLLNVENKILEAKYLVEDSSTKNENESNSIQNNARRNHCYMYVFKKS